MNIHAANITISVSSLSLQDGLWQAKNDVQTEVTADGLSCLFQCFSCESLKNLEINTHILSLAYFGDVCKKNPSGTPLECFRRKMPPSPGYRWHPQHENQLIFQIKASFVPCKIIRSVFFKQPLGSHGTLKFKETYFRGPERALHVFLFVYN